MFAKKYRSRGEALNLIRFIENIRTDLTKYHPDLFLRLLIQRMREEMEPSRPSILMKLQMPWLYGM